MPTMKERILEVLSTRPGLTDREITDLVKGRRENQQHVNLECRRMEGTGTLRRNKRHDGLIGNYPMGAKARAGKSTPPTQENSAPSRLSAAKGVDDPNMLSEDEVKRLLVAWLEREGWSVEVAWGKARGIDVDALRGGERWIIEAKGCGSLQPMRVNYFLAILGETLQRMSDPQARYSIALPDLPQFRGLWDRLPKLTKERTGITALFIGADGSVRLEQ